MGQVAVDGDRAQPQHGGYAFQYLEELRHLNEARKEADTIGSDSPLWRGRVLRRHGEANFERDLDFLRRLERELRESDPD